MLTAEKINETYALIKGPAPELQDVYDFLRVERPGAYFEVAVQRGFKSPYEYFAEITNDGLKVYLGLLDILSAKFNFNTISNIQNYDIEEVDSFYEQISNEMPFKPYDFQEKAFKECILKSRNLVLMCTGSGKSAVISMCLEFYRRHGRQGLLIVPNINLLTQFRSDIQSYGLTELYDSIEVLGDGIVPTFEKPILISTWQSMVKHLDKLGKYSFLIEDEVHRESAEVAGDIARKCLNVGIRLGFTGTMPESPVQKMELMGLFCKPTRYVRSRELIDRGLGTPIKIISIFFKYNDNLKGQIRNAKTYSQQLKLIKEYYPRIQFVSKLALRLKSANQNTLVLFQHTEHGKEIFREIMSIAFPDVTVEDKDITGKLSFDFQKQYHIFFLNGEDDAKTREKTRLILEEIPDAVLVANYSLLSTGVNIKQLHNLVLASPLKAYTTITQSIGRGIRLHPGKKEFKVFDLVDDIGVRKPSGVFVKSYRHRCETSYFPEEYDISEKAIEI